MGAGLHMPSFLEWGLRVSSTFTWVPRLNWWYCLRSMVPALHPSLLPGPVSPPLLLSATRLLFLSPEHITLIPASASRPLLQLNESPAPPVFSFPARHVLPSRPAFSEGPSLTCHPFLKLLRLLISGLLTLSCAPRPPQPSFPSWPPLHPNCFVLPTSVNMDRCMAPCCSPDTLLLPNPTSRPILICPLKPTQTLWP